MREVDIEATIVSVRQLLGVAERLAESVVRNHGNPEDLCMDSNALATSIDTAFAELLLITESMGLTRTYDEIRKSYDEAAKREDGFSAGGTDPYGEVYLCAATSIRKHVKSLESVYGLKSSQTFTKDVIEVLRASLYAITDINCFPAPPSSEDEMHHRIEAVLRCVFPDLDHKPVIPKPIKNFIADTGLPSIRTLIEYKFVDSQEKAKTVAEEILADTRGYTSNEWDEFIFVIYETARIKPERVWNRLLEKCRTAVNTQAIVLHGETVALKRTHVKKPPSKQS